MAELNPDQPTGPADPPPPAEVPADLPAEFSTDLPVPADAAAGPRRRWAKARVVKSRPLSRTRPPVPPAPPREPRRRENRVRRWFRHRVEFARDDIRVYRRVAQLVIGAAVIVLVAILVYPPLLVLLIKLFSG